VILVRYDFNDVSYTGPSATDIEMVEVELVVANDYLIEMSSNRQLDANGRQAFLPAFEAKGNVKDGSNQRVLTVDYGMPTANQIAGMTVRSARVQMLRGAGCQSPVSPVSEPRVAGASRCQHGSAGLVLQSVAADVSAVRLR
jgi:hypothetical protein